jgi:hypothetical protein
MVILKSTLGSVGVGSVFSISLSENLGILLSLWVAILAIHNVISSDLLEYKSTMRFESQLVVRKSFCY